jgi:hypothetical protein
MGAIMGTGIEGIEAARCYSAAQEAFLRGHSVIPDISTLAERTAKLIDEGKEKEAYERFCQAHEELERTIRRLRASMANVKRGIRWQTGLHRQSGTDPLPANLLA